MKIIISILFALTAFSTYASESTAAKGEHKEETKHHKDWNEVFKQPVSKQELSVIPEKTQIVEPAFLAQVKGPEVVLKWKAVEGAKYHLQVATDPNFKWIVTNENLVDYTEYALKNLEPKQQYFWRVFTQKPENMRGYTQSQAVGSSFETAQ